MMGLAVKYLSGIILVLGVVTVLAVFTSTFLVKYGVSIPAEHNETFQTLSDTASFVSFSEEIKNSALNEDEEDQTFFSEIVDLIGKWFQRGLQIVRLIPNSMNLFNSMSEALVNSNTPFLGIAAEPIKFIITNILVIIVIVGILISAYIKYQL